MIGKSSDGEELREVGDGEATGDAQGGRRRHARGEEFLEDTGKYKLYFTR
jgi:hypothetical protein